MRRFISAITLLFALGPVLPAAAQYYYSDATAFEGVQTMVVLRDEQNEDALANLKMIVPANWTLGPIDMAPIEDLMSLATKKHIGFILPLADRTDSDMIAYSLAYCRLDPKDGIESKPSGEGAFFDRGDFEVIAEVIVDSAYYADALYRRIYLRSVLGLSDHYARNFGKSGVADYYRWGFALHRNDSIFIAKSDISEVLREQEKITALVPRMKIVSDLAKNNAFRMALRNKMAIAEIFEVRRAGKRYALRCLYTLEKGLIYSEERELTSEEMPLYTRADIARLETKLREDEKAALLRGDSIGR